MDPRGEMVLKAILVTSLQDYFLKVWSAFEQFLMFQLRSLLFFKTKVRGHLFVRSPDDAIVASGSLG
jgi:hypothetical protein